MQECLIDIGHAIHHGYVITSQEDKLLKRKEKCFAQQRKAKKHQATRTRAEDTRLFSAFESEHVTVKSLHTCGRYIEVLNILACLLASSIYDKKESSLNLIFSCIKILTAGSSRSSTWRCRTLGRAICSCS